MDQANAAEPVNLGPSLSNTVAVLNAKARAKSVAVSLELEPELPKVRGFAGELNQVWGNLIDKYQKNGVQAVNSGTLADVRHNTITASAEPVLQAIIASNGVVVFGGAAATVEGNVISGNKFTPTPLSTGVILDEAPAGSSEVDHNRIFDNDYGIETDTLTGLEISHNDVFNSVADAITLCGDTSLGCGPAEQIVVRSNDVENNGGSGILLLGADSNLLKSNHVAGNGTKPRAPTRPTGSGSM